jgi:hypothetical protein
MQTKKNNGREKQGHFLPLINASNIPSNFFETKRQWEDLPRYVFSFANFAITNVLPPFTLFGGKRKTYKKKPAQKRKTKSTLRERNYRTSSSNT